MAQATVESCYASIILHTHVHAFFDLAALTCTHVRGEGDLMSVNALFFRKQTTQLDPCKLSITALFKCEEVHCDN